MPLKGIQVHIIALTKARPTRPAAASTALIASGLGDSGVFTMIAMDRIGILRTWPTPVPTDEARSQSTVPALSQTATDAAIRVTVAKGWGKSG